MIALRRAALLGAFAALVSCGGGGASSVPAAVTTQTQSVVVQLPATTDVTKLGVLSSLTPGTPEQQFGVAATSGGCTTSGATRTCTAALKLPLGAQVLTVTTYGAKTVHSTWRTTLTGVRLALSVGATIAQISLDLAVPQLAGGAAGTTTLYVTARDANGNTIVGDFGGASIAVTSTDTTNSIALSPTTVTAGGTPVTVSYNGSGSVASVTFNATSTGVAASAIVAATLTFTASQVMYATAANSILIFPRGATGDVAPIQRIVFPNAQFVDAAEPDLQGNLWVLTSVAPVTNGSNTIYGSAVATVAANLNGLASSPNYLPASAFPAQSVSIGIGVDGTGTLYDLVETVAQTYSIEVFAAGSTSPSRTIAPSVFSGQTCLGIDAYTDGTVAVKCATGSLASIYVFAPGASGNATPERTIAGAATMQHPLTAYVVFAPDGSLLTADYDSSENTSLLLFAPGANGNVAPVRRIAGAGTGLDSVSLSLMGGAQGYTYGIGIDSSGTIYAGQYGSQTTLNSGQILIFGPTANGAVPPTAVLGGPLTGLGTDYVPIHFGNATVAPAAAGTPSVSGDFLNLAAGRVWNYTFTQLQDGGTPSPPVTLSLAASSASDGNLEVDAYEASGTPATAIGAPGAVIASQALFYQSEGGGWFASGYVPISSGASLGGFVPIPGGIKLTAGTLAQGQNFPSYIGLTANVISVGAVPGASACPGGAATGAIVTYTFGQFPETVGYVPGCGITYFVSDGGSTAILTSVGTATAPSTARREPLSTDGIQTLRRLWRSAFTPWKAK